MISLRDVETSAPLLRAFSTPELRTAFPEVAEATDALCGAIATGDSASLAGNYQKLLNVLASISADYPLLAVIPPAEALRVLSQRVLSLVFPAEMGFDEAILNRSQRVCTGVRNMGSLFFETSIDVPADLTGRLAFFASLQDEGGQALRGMVEHNVNEALHPRFSLPWFLQWPAPVAELLLRLKFSQALEDAQLLRDFKSLFLEESRMLSALINEALSSCSPVLRQLVLVQSSHVEVAQLLESSGPAEWSILRQRLPVFRWDRTAANVLIAGHGATVPFGWQVFGPLRPLPMYPVGDEIWLQLLGSIAQRRIPHFAGDLRTCTEFLSGAVAALGYRTVTVEGPLVKSAALDRLLTSKAWVIVTGIESVPSQEQHSMAHLWLERWSLPSEGFPVSWVITVSDRHSATAPEYALKTLLNGPAELPPTSLARLPPAALHVLGLANPDAWTAAQAITEAAELTRETLPAFCRKVQSLATGMRQMYDCTPLEAVQQALRVLLQIVPSPSQRAIETLPALRALSTQPPRTVPTCEPAVPTARDYATHTKFGQQSYAPVGTGLPTARKVTPLAAKAPLESGTVALRQAVDSLLRPTWRTDPEYVCALALLWKCAPNHVALCSTEHYEAAVASLRLLYDVLCYPAPSRDAVIYLSVSCDTTFDEFWGRSTADGKWTPGVFLTSMERARRQQLGGWAGCVAVCGELPREVISGLITAGSSVRYEQGWTLPNGEQFGLRGVHLVLVVPPATFADIPQGFRSETPVFQVERIR